MEIKSEKDLHFKVVGYIRFYPDTLMIPGLGENQISECMHIDS